MIKFENVDIGGIRPAIRGMRNPKNSWERSDSQMFEGDYMIGPNDKGLMESLAIAGPVHAKYRRMIVVWVDITAPLYWWKEFDTYKVGTVANSCSTMHKIADKEFIDNDFSCEHLQCDSKIVLKIIIERLNWYRKLYLSASDEKLKKTYWRQMIQLLPSSYNQKRTIMMSYEVLANIYHNGRRTHKLDEWRQFCEWAERLDYSECFTCDKTDADGVTIVVPKDRVTPEAMAFLDKCMKDAGTIEFSSDAASEESEKQATISLDTVALTEVIDALFNQHPRTFDRVYYISPDELRKVQKLGGNKNNE